MRLIFILALHAALVVYSCLTLQSITSEGANRGQETLILAQGLRKAVEILEHLGDAAKPARRVMHSVSRLVKVSSSMGRQTLFIR